MDPGRKKRGRRRKVERWQKDSGKRGGGWEKTDRKEKYELPGRRLWKIEEKRETGLVSSFRFFEKYFHEEKDGGTSEKSHERDDEEEAGHAGTTLETRPGRELTSSLQHLFRLHCTASYNDIRCLIDCLPACLPACLPVNDQIQSYDCIFVAHSLFLSVSLSLPFSLFLSVRLSPSLCLIILCRLLHSPFFALLLLNDDRHVPSTSPFARCRCQRLLFSFFPIICIYRFLRSLVCVPLLFHPVPAPLCPLFRIVSFCHGRI